MRTINRKRAEILTPIMQRDETEEEAEESALEDLDCQFTVNAFASKLLLGFGAYSYTETAKCRNCPSETKTSEFSTLNTHSSLRVDLSNLVEAVLANFPDPLCYQCQDEKTVEFQFGQFVFIQVKMFDLKCLAHKRYLIIIRDDFN